MLRAYGQDTWFWLGDRDLATHLLRSQWLRAGRTPTEVAAALSAALGVSARLLPMCDEPVATRVHTPDGELEFQEYFVRRRQADTVLGVRFQGIETASVPEGVGEALARADLLIFCPSNPIVSIGPILAVPGVRAALAAASSPKVAVSPIVGGRALKGPADRMLASLGHEVSALGIARIYAGLLDGMVIDTVDSDQRAAIERLGMRVCVTGTVMHDESDRRRLAAQVLEFGKSLHAGR
jgi:LPPG:FO 2-phospho-L-lactate transferase